jgi:cytoskeletal protein CcmA (bactofilin family)
MVAKSVVISGNVNGDIEGQERVELCKGSVVKGNIKTSNIRIADNVEFEGEVEMLEGMPSVDLFSVASSEYKRALHQKTGNIH